MRPRLGIVAAILVLAAIAGLVGYLNLRESGGADASDPELVSLGRVVYATHCASCHGAELEGQPSWRERRPDGRLPAPPHNAEGHTWHHSDRQLFIITKKGTAAIVPGYQSDMRGFGDALSDREIWAVLAYVKSRWPPVIRSRQALRSEADR